MHLTVVFTNCTEDTFYIVNAATQGPITVPLRTI